MEKRKLEDNTLYILGTLIWGAVATIGKSFLLLGSNLLGKKTKPIPENKFLDTLHFLVYAWPKRFWNKPSGLELGRSIATFIHYIFYKKTSFRRDTSNEKKKN